MYIIITKYKININQMKININQIENKYKPNRK